MLVFVIKKILREGKGKGERRGSRCER